MPFVPENKSTVCFWKPKIIVSLRNPVDRAYYFYQMKTLGRNISFPSFKELLKESIISWLKWGVTSLPVDFTEWLELPDIAFTNEWNITIDEERKKMVKDILVRGLYAKELKPWLSPFKLTEHVHVIQYEESVLDQILEFVGVPPFNLDLSVLNSDFSPSKKRKKRVKPVEMARDTLAALRRRFRPYNQELVELLGEEWRNVRVEDTS
jgi:hypothetical protein